MDLYKTTLYERQRHEAAHFTSWFSTTSFSLSPKGTQSRDGVRVWHELTFATHTAKRTSICDTHSQRKFFIVCGADHSVSTPTQSMEDLYKHTNDDHDDVCARDYAATDTPIQTYGTHLPKVSFGFRRVLQFIRLSIHNRWRHNNSRFFYSKGIQQLSFLWYNRTNEQQNHFRQTTFAHHPYNGYHFFM